MADRDTLEVRRARDDDLEAVLALLRASLGWMPDDQHASFFVWKHWHNPFGPSPAWVAVEGERIVGFRTFLNWELERGRRQLRAVRAVDTATHPDYQGRGVFSRLTLHALEELRADRVDFVFNTPNDQSRPGYLKMGWKQIGQVPLLFRSRGVGSLLRTTRARTAAEKWSVPTSAGLAADEALGDRRAVAHLVASLPADDALRTRRTPEFMAWRYRFGPLAYRTALAGTTIEDGIAVFRLRRRGPALEAAVCDLLVPDGAQPALKAVLNKLLRASGADYAVRVGGEGVPRLGYLPLPGQGPALLWRGLLHDEAPAAGAWHLTLGDIELF